MTDARLKGEWLTAAAHDGLSDAAYRIFHNALMHSNEQGTDGAIDRRELRFLYPEAITDDHLQELVDAGFWERTEAGFQFLGWSDGLGQSTRVDVEAMRESNRKRKARQRERERAILDQTGPSGSHGPSGASEGFRSPKSHRDSQGESRESVTVGVGQDRTGQDRPPGGGLPVRSKRRAGARGRALQPVPDCNIDGHQMDKQGITCLRPNCEYRDRDRQAQYAAGTLGGTP